METTALSPPPPQVLVFTDAAAGKVGELIKEESNPNLKLRVFVSGGGCSGFQYAFDIVEARESDDLAVERDGATVLIHPVSVGFMTGSVIDFVDDLIGQSFKITNPNATASCGCGTSFAM